MKQNVYHGILVNLAFTDTTFPEQFRIFSRKTAGDWTIYGIIVENDNVRIAITGIQSHMRSDENFYAHLYNDDSLIVIFKDRYFEANPHISSWNEIVAYGAEKGIPRGQLDFWPNRFQDEIHYFDIIP